MTRTLSLLCLALLTASAVAAQTPDGAALFEDRCAMCHTPPGVDRAPTVEALRARGAEAIINALTTGVMQVEGQDLTPGERAAIAAFVAGAPAGGVATPVSGRAQRM